jgi:hypothetical protein
MADYAGNHTRLINTKHEVSDWYSRQVEYIVPTRFQRLHSFYSAESQLAPQEEMWSMEFGVLDTC